MLVHTVCYGPYVLVHTVCYGPYMYVLVHTVCYGPYVLVHTVCYGPYVLVLNVMAPVYMYMWSCVNIMPYVHNVSICMCAHPLVLRDTLPWIGGVGP